VETEIGGACGTHRESEGSYRVLVGNPGGRRQLERPRRKWKNNMKMYLEKVGWRGVGMAWIVLAHWRDRWRALVIDVMNLRVS
jgi:hypothetical protein